MAAKADSNTEHRDTEIMQEANATGASQNEQGRASFITGSTIGGGSNFGQGSHHLGGESYKQGSTANTGSNYGNEIGGLGDSSTGTSNEGSSSVYAGAAHSGASGEHEADYNACNSYIGSSATEGRHQGEQSEQDPVEGERRNTTILEQSSNLDSGSTAGQRRADGGSWSSATNS